MSQSVQSTTPSTPITNLLVFQLPAPNPLKAHHRAALIFLSGPTVENANDQLLTMAKNALTVQNLAAFWNSIIALKCSALDEYCLDFFKKHVHEINIKDLSIQQMKIIVEKSDLSNLFEMIVKWINETPVLPQFEMEKLFIGIDYSKISVVDYFNTISKLSVINQDICKKIIEVKYNNIMVAIGLYTESYIGYKRIESADLTEDFLLKLNSELKNHGGCAALTDIEVWKFYLMRTDKNKILINGDSWLETCYVRNTTAGKMVAGSCEITNTKKQTKINKIVATCVCMEETLLHKIYCIETPRPLYAFFVKI